jgi:hypothetical protein
LSSIKTAASILGVELIVSAVNDPTEIDGAFAAIAEYPDGGLIVMPNFSTAVNQERIVAQAARFRVPKTALLTAPEAVMRARLKTGYSMATAWYHPVSRKADATVGGKCRRHLSSDCAGAAT